MTPLSTRGGSTIGGKHRSKRLKNFSLPDGREVHIALSPEEALSMKQRLEAIKNSDTFDLVISGSPEHIEALRKAHSHHEQRRHALREKHGEAYDEFESVREDLDALSVDLHMLTDHAVSLDANFSKYGYDAHLRTYDDPLESSGSSMHGHDDSDHESKDWEAERKNGRIFKLYKKPVVRQYFHRGLLWRASNTTEVATFELFLDLLYVGIIAINGDSAAETPTANGLNRFAITFIMSWRIWGDMTVVISWFETDDILQRISVLFIMACLVGLTTNMLQAFEETYSQLVAFYLAARFFIGSYYALISYVVPMVRGMMIAQVIGIVIPSGIWIASIYVNMPQRLALIWLALFVDLFASIVTVFFIRSSHFISDRLAAWVERVFEFYPAVNIEHKTERTNAFVTLIFGYSVVALLYQNSASFGINAFYGKAVLGLLQAFCLNTIYFEIDGDSLWQHAIRRDVASCESFHHSMADTLLIKAILYSIFMGLSPSSFPSRILPGGCFTVQTGCGT
jgi:low temperature requirement protein LtrA